MIEERRPALSRLLHERLYPRCGAAVGIARQKFGDQPGPRALDFRRQNLGSVHADRLQFFGSHIIP
jgi:hypothetical protein